MEDENELQKKTYEELRKINERAEKVEAEKFLRKKEEDEKKAKKEADILKSTKQMKTGCLVFIVIIIFFSLVGACLDDKKTQTDTKDPFRAKLTKIYPPQNINKMGPCGHMGDCVMADVLGFWQGHAVSGNPKESTSNYEFKEDGTVTNFYHANAVGAEIVNLGWLWSLKNNQITITMVPNGGELSELTKLNKEELKDHQFKLKIKSANIIVGEGQILKKIKEKKE